MTRLPLGSALEKVAQLEIPTGSESVVKRTVLPGGIRVLTETMPAQHSVTMGAWIAVGSRDEIDGHQGSTHFLEHLLFKGTPSRDAMDIASAFDSVGGEANAATGKEHTCYYARVLDSDLPMATEVIMDMVTSASLTQRDFDSERGVILEELAMSEDDPVDLAHEGFAAQIFGDHSLGRPIGGTPQTINAIPRAAVWEHYRSAYVPAELVVVAAGSVDHEALCAQVAACARAGGWTLNEAASPSPRRVLGTPFLRHGRHADGIADTGSARTLTRSFEQAHVLFGGLGPADGDDRRFILTVLNAALGGSMSSRLFQEVREKRGLAYTVYSFAQTFADAGAFGMYAGCSPAKVEEVVAILDQQWRLLATEDIAPIELDRAIGQMCGALVLGLEDSGSRMSRLGRCEITTGEFLTIEETLDRIRSVTAPQIRELAADLYAQPRHLTIVGPFDSDIAAKSMPDPGPVA